MSSKCYLKMLHSFSPKLQQGLLLDKPWFQQDGDRIHRPISVWNQPPRCFSRQMDGRKWTASLVTWPLTWFFFWGYLKNAVYKCRRANLRELKASNWEESSKVHESILQRVSIQLFRGSTEALHWSWWWHYTCLEKWFWIQSFFHCWKLSIPFQFLFVNH